MDTNYDVIIFTSNNFNLKRAKAANFAGIIKIATPFVQPASKDSKKNLKELEISS